MGITEISQGEEGDTSAEEEQAEGSESNSENGSEEESGETPEGQGQDGDEEEGLVVSLEGEDPSTAEDGVPSGPAPAWLKDLRKEHRAVVRELRELKAEKAAASHVNEPKQEIGPRPKMSDPDIDFDEEVFDRKLDAWHQRKTEIEGRERDARAQQERAETEWKTKVETHQKAAAALRVPDYEEAADVVRGSFNEIQQAILLEADNSALLAYAIGKRPAKAKELASISNPVKFAMALAKLETQVKTQPKKTAPAPETRVRASAPVSGAVDSKLAKLMEEADRTGDRTKVAAYHRERSRQQAA